MPKELLHTLLSSTLQSIQSQFKEIEKRLQNLERSAQNSQQVYIDMMHRGELNLTKIYSKITSDCKDIEKKIQILSLSCKSLKIKLDDLHDKVNSCEIIIKRLQNDKRIMRKVYDILLSSPIKIVAWFSAISALGALILEYLK